MKAKLYVHNIKSKLWSTKFKTTLEMLCAKLQCSIGDHRAHLIEAWCGLKQATVDIRLISGIRRLPDCACVCTGDHDLAEPVIRTMSFNARLSLIEFGPCHAMDVVRPAFTIFCWFLPQKSKHFFRCWCTRSHNVANERATINVAECCHTP